MTGPDHYREAERCVSYATNADREADPNDVAMMLRFAQVHATLALTAATIDAAAHPGQSQIDYLGQWWRAQS